MQPGQEGNIGLRVKPERPVGLFSRYVVSSHSGVLMHFLDNLSTNIENHEIVFHFRSPFGPSTRDAAGHPAATFCSWMVS